jgi:hypothetical protein
VNPERADPRGARQRRAWRHLVSAAKLPIVCLGVNRISMVRTYTAAINTDASSTLINKISIAAVAIHNQIANEPEMKILEDLAPSSEGGTHYREIADNLRLLAHQIRFPNARREILDIAIRYEQRSHHFDTRAMLNPPD